MAILKVVEAPDKILEKVSLKVESINEEVIKLANDMLDTMYNENGVGLSAVQVGVLKRLITVDVTQERDDDGNLIKKGEQFVMVNPEIVSSSQEKKDYEEGCLSFPGERVKITRPALITVKYLNLKGETNEIECSGLFAICVQHEIDHLNGITIDKYLSHLRKELMIKRLVKRKKRINF